MNEVTNEALTIADKSTGSAVISQKGSGRRSGRIRPGVAALGSLLVLLVIWEFFGRQMNPIFASYPSAIAVSLVDEIRDGTLPSALLESLQPLLLGYGIAAAIGTLVWWRALELYERPWGPVLLAAECALVMLVALRAASRRVAKPAHPWLGLRVQAHGSSPTQK